MRKYKYGFHFGTRPTLAKGLYFVMDSLFIQVRNSIVRGNIDADDVKHMELAITRIPREVNADFHHKNDGFKITLTGAGHIYSTAINMDNNRHLSACDVYVEAIPHNVTRNDSFAHYNKHNRFISDITIGDMDCLHRTYRFLHNLYQKPENEEQRKKLIDRLCYLKDVMFDYKMHLINWAYMIQKTLKRRDNTPQLIRRLRNHFDFDDVKVQHAETEDGEDIYTLVKNEKSVSFGFKKDSEKLNSFLFAGGFDKSLYSDISDAVFNFMFKHGDLTEGGDK